MVFLKRSPYPEMDLSKFYLGNAVVIHGRQHNILGYANEYTKNALSQTQEKTLAIIKPHCYRDSPDAIPDLIRQT